MASPVTWFDDLYRRSDDPWGMRERWYERRKRQLTVAALPCERYRNGFEPGCANGELTAALASRCDTLLAWDVNETAAQLARVRVAGLPHVRIEQRTMPSDWPDGPFDLIVISEVAYYLDGSDLQQLADRIRETLSPEGALLACHWRHPFDEALQSAEAVHTMLDTRCGFARISHHDEPDFLLD